MPIKHTKKFGWVSQEAIDSGNNYIVYLDTDGEEVIVTYINESSTDSGWYHWKDVKCVGEITQYVRTVKNCRWFKL